MRKPAVPARIHHRCNRCRGTGSLKSEIWTDGTMAPIRREAYPVTCRLCNGRGFTTFARPLFWDIGDVESWVRTEMEELANEFDLTHAHFGFAADPENETTNLVERVMHQNPEEAGNILAILLEPLVRQSLDSMEANQ